MKKRYLHVQVTEGTAATLERLAAEHGLIAASGGPRHGRPSVQKLLDAIGRGELKVCGNPGQVTRQA